MRGGWGIRECLKLRNNLDYLAKAKVIDQGGPLTPVLVFLSSLFSTLPSAPPPSGSGLDYWGSTSYSTELPRSLVTP